MDSISLKRNEPILLKCELYPSLQCLIINQNAIKYNVNSEPKTRLWIQVSEYKSWTYTVILIIINIIT